jgi:hypothetical protein
MQQILRRKADATIRFQQRFGKTRHRAKNATGAAPAPISSSEMKACGYEL